VRFILINALNDPTLEKRRSQYPGEVCRRPSIAGKPLGRGARRVILGEALNEKVLDQIEHHVKVGNVKFLQIGKVGNVDFAQLRKRLGFPVIPIEQLRKQPTDDVRMAEAMIFVAAQTDEWRAKALARTLEHGSGWFIEDDWGIVFVPEPPVPLSEEPVPVDEEPFVADEPLVPPPSEPLDLDDILDPSEEEDAPEEPEFSVPDDLRERLGGAEGPVTNPELREILALLGGTGKGKRKSELIDDIMDAINDPSVDVVQAQKALERLAEAEED